VTGFLKADLDTFVAMHFRTPVLLANGVKKTEAGDVGECPSWNLLSGVVPLRECMQADLSRFESLPLGEAVIDFVRAYLVGVDAPLHVWIIYHGVDVQSFGCLNVLRSIHTQHPK